MASEDVKRLHEQIARAAIREFENDLRGMTPEQIEEELRRVTEKVDELTAWQEALAAAKEYGL